MKKRTLVVFIAAGLLLCGCSGKNNNDNNTNKDIDNNVDNNINYVVGDYDFREGSQRSGRSQRKDGTGGAYSKSD